jgi:hypothetical protein
MRMGEIADLKFEISQWRFRKREWGGLNSEI